MEARAAVVAGLELPAEQVFQDKVSQAEPVHLCFQEVAVAEVVLEGQAVPAPPVQQEERLVTVAQVFHLRLLVALSLERVVAAVVLLALVLLCVVSAEQGEVEMAHTTMHQAALVSVPQTARLILGAEAAVIQVLWWVLLQLIQVLVVRVLLF